MDVLVEMLLEHGHRCDHVRLSARRECMELHVGRDHRGDELGVRGRPGAATADGLGDVVNLAWNRDAGTAEGR